MLLGTTSVSCGPPVIAWPAGLCRSLDQATNMDIGYERLWRGNLRSMSRSWSIKHDCPGVNVDSKIMALVSQDITDFKKRPQSDMKSLTVSWFLPIGFGFPVQHIVYLGEPNHPGKKGDYFFASTLLHLYVNLGTELIKVFWKAGKSIVNEHLLLSTTLAVYFFWPL